ncbi:MAG TPA: hypothetical protein VFZ09_40030 [Archangium sp.]|uniref:hypothetical protein n=1 Tax=Archangium sp. TaxID=1872627 RepID=UPI002E3529CD|nr:hypothetical protein [Archangium sp.]HEX5752463.1 hypothetical protein [Archangium sp.]
MGSEVNLEWLGLLFTLSRHLRPKHGTTQGFMERVDELRTDKTRKRRSGSGNHVTQCLVGAIGGDSLSKRFGHESKIPVLNGHSHTEFAIIGFHGRFIDDGRMDTRGTPAIGSRLCFLDNRGESEVAWLVMIDAATREDWQCPREQSQEKKY